MVHPRLARVFFAALVASVLSQPANAQFGQVELPVHERLLRFFPADVDGDGRKELIGSDADYGGDMVLFRMNGRGQLRRVRTLFPDMVFAERVLLADLNGDGFDDLVGQSVSAFGYGTPVYAMFGNGGLDFDTPVLVADAVECTHSVPVDIDADGDVDLVQYPGSARSIASVWTGTTIKWRENAGGGQLGPAQDLQATPANVLRAVAVDLDRDGDLDFVAERESDRELIVLRNTGGLLHEEATPFPLTPFYELHAADFTGDGFQDLLVVSAGPGLAAPFSLEVMLNDGAGGLGAPTTILAGSGTLPATVTVLDHNQDGHADIAYMAGVAGDRSQLTLLLGDSTGDFSARWTSAATPGITPTVLASGDWDGDGDDDLIHRDRFGSSATSRPRVNVSLSQPLDASQPVRVGTRTFVSWGGVWGIAADLDGDGMDDLIQRTRFGLAWSRSEISAPYFDLPVPLVFDAQTRSTYPVLAADLDGDGVNEVVFQRTRLNYDVELMLLDRRADGSVSLADLPVPLAARTGDRMEAVDWDGDGDLDLIGAAWEPYAPVWFENQGAGSFEPPALLSPVADRHQAYRTGDFNGDGRLDLLGESWRNAPGASSVVYERLSGGTLAAPVVFYSEEVTQTLVHDVNFDGFDDVLWRRHFDDGVQAFLGGPAGLSSSLTTVIADAGDYGGRGTLRANDWTLLDADLDGLLDLAMLDSQRQPLGVFLALPSGGFSSFPLVVHPLEACCGFEDPLAEMLAGDFDGDGATDLFMCERRLDTIWWRNEAAGAFAAVGRTACRATVPNSSGLPGRMVAYGQRGAATNRLTLHAMDLARGSVGFFLTSQANRAPISVPGSLGQLCLGGAIGRFLGPGQVTASTSAGTMRLELDLTSMPTPAGMVSALPGSTWFFQAWHRDSVAGSSTSNFTGAVGVTFE